MRDAVGNVESVLVLGGGSEIAAETVRQLIAGRCRRVVLAVRTPSKVEALSKELTDLGASVNVVTFDGADFESHASVIASIFSDYGDIDLAISAFGVLGSQDELDNDPAAGARLVNVNFSGQVSALTALSNEMKGQGHGKIVVMSSVAGERVRKDNAIYGSTKAGLDGYAQGLSDRLVGTGVELMIVRPGFVKTAMTEGLDPAPFSTTADAVAKDIIDGLGKRSEIVWSPGILRYLFVVMRHLPRPLWRFVSNR